METTMLYATKHALSQKDTLKLLDSTLPKRLHQSSELNPSVPYSLLQTSTIYTFSTQMLKQHSSMTTAILNSTLSSPKDSWTEVIPTKFYGSENRFMALNKHLVRIWYLLLCQHILDLGFKSCESDPSIYINIEKSIILSVYVDDILIFGLNQRSCEKIFQQLSSQFKMQNLGPPKTFLGLNITKCQCKHNFHQSNGIHPPNVKAIQDATCVPAKTPLPHSLPLVKAT